MPESFFILSKDYLELGSNELVSLAKMYDKFAKIRIISNLIIISSKTDWEKIARRASFVKVSGQISRKMSGLFLDGKNRKILKNSMTFRCRAINLSSRRFNIPELESSMGDMISKFSRARVKLDDPDITVYLIFAAGARVLWIFKTDQKAEQAKEDQKLPP